MTEILGSAELETGVDLKGLDAGLMRAEARVARSAAVMQAMLDRLHADVDVRGAAIEAAAARVASIPSTGGATGSSTSTSNIRQSQNEVWGVRGPVHAGSIQNPIVTVLAASKFFPMGSYGAAIGDSNTTDEQRGDTGFATTADMAALTAAVADLARNASPVNGLAAAGSQGMTEPGAAERTVVMLDRQNGDALARAAVAMESVASSARSSTQDTRSLLTAVRSGDTATQRDLMGFPVGSSTTVPRAAEHPTAADAAALAAALRGFAAQRGASIPVTLTSAEAAKRLGVAPGRVYYLAGSGDLTGAQKVRGAWQIPESSVAAYMAANAAGGSGGGSGPILPVALGGGGGNGGGGNSGLLSKLLWGGGSALGLAGFGSLGSLAGLGPEHLLMTALGIAGSAGTAVAGGSLLGLGALGVGGAGMAADASGIGQAASDIKNVTTALSQYQSISQMVAKQIPQSAAAQKALNTQLAAFAPSARSAVLAASLTASQFHGLFDLFTGPAEATGANIINQAIQLGEKFLPALGQAASTDAHIIQQGLQPLFGWLGGPEGIGIFQNLEHEFTQNLPYGISAFDNGLEGVLRIMNIASGYTGGFVQHLDDLFKKLNGMSNVQLEQVVGRLIGDFRVWEAFVKALGTDIFRLFNNDVGTGKSIIVTLTQMLQHVGKYEDSVTGRQHLMTIFTVHKNEVQALLHLLPLLLDPLAKLYLTVAPAATTALTDLAKGITAVVKAIESIPGGSWILAIGLLTSRLGLASALFRGGTAAAASGAGATAEDAAGGAAGAGLLTKLFAAVGKTGAGTAVAGGVETGALGAASVAEGAGLEGLAAAIIGAGATIAPLAAGFLPILAAAGGIYGLVKLFGLFSNPVARTSYTTPQLAHLLRSPQPGVLSRPAIQGAPISPMHTGPAVESGRLTARSSVTQPATFTLADIANTKQAKDALQQWYNVAKSSVSVSKLNVDQLAAMVREGNRLAQIFPKDAQLIDKLNAPIKKTVAGLNDVINQMMMRWITDADSGLSTLTGVFNSNLEDISAKVGLSSHEGEKLWKNNIDQMVKDVTDGMLKGRIATSAGMDAINKVTSAGVKGNAITWQQQSSLMLSTIQAMYQAGKLPPEQYYADLQQLTQQGLGQIKNDAHDSTAKQIADTKALFQQGNDGLVVTQGQLNSQLHQIRVKGNTQAAQDMQLWLAGLTQQMSAAGTVSTEGANAILTPLNTALQELGQKPVTLVTLNALNNIPAAGSFNPGSTPGGPSLTGAPAFPGMTGIPGAASGALYQIGQPGQGGRDTVPLNVAGIPVMVGGGEQVAVFNRHQQPIVNLALSLLGYDGMSGLFSDVNTPNFMAGGGKIKTPSAAGGGAQSSLLNAAFRMLGVDANRYLKHKTASSKGKGGGGGVAPAAWMQVASMLAKKMGWGAAELSAWLGVEHIEDGSFSLTAKNPASSAYGLAQFINGPGEYATYGGNSNTLLGQLTAMANYIKGRYGVPSAALAHEHSAGFYASGGFPFGRGGDRYAGRPSSGSQDLGLIKSAMGRITGLVGSNVGSGGDAGRMQELLGYWPGLWSISNPNLGQSASAFITTTDALGNSIPPVIDQADVTKSGGELAKELGWENEYIKDLTSARGMAKTWHPRVETAISKRRNEIRRLRAAQAAKVKGIRDKINANLKQIAAYQKQITQLNNKISTEQNKKKPNYTAIGTYRKQISGLQSKITALEGTNRTLGGAGTYVGTGGEIAHVQTEYGTEVASVASEITTLSGYSSALAGIPGTVSGETGVGGLLGPALTQKATLQAAVKQLGPAALAAALATANTSYASSSGSSTNSSLTSLLEQQNLTLAEQLAVSQAQYNVLAAMPPYAGVFHRGGTVPGPVGAEMMARVQGGEIITPIGGAAPGGGGDGETHVHLHGALAAMEKFIDVRVEKGTRRMASAAGRSRPGQRRGLIAPLR